MEKKQKIHDILNELNRCALTEEETVNKILLLFGVSGSCSCGVKYVETKKSDIPYDTWLLYTSDAADE